MPIRAATPEDARRIAEIHVDSWRAAYRGIMPEATLAGLDVERREIRWRRHLAEQTEPALVAESGGRVIGWLTYGPCRDADAAADDGQVFGMYLDPATYRQGIGRQLWAAAVERLRTNGCRRIAVWTLSVNEPARRFYETMGGVPDHGSECLYTGQGVSMPQVRYWCVIE